MAGQPKQHTSGFRLRRLEKPEEFRSAEELERQALGEDAALAVPAPLLRTFRDNGGLVLGAFADIYLAGVAVSSIGWDGSALYHLSHLTVVRPEYQNHRLGFRLKAFQRDEVLGLGLSEIRWSFDPLSSRAARLAIHRLGARPDRYLTNYFGRLSDAGSADPETDRLAVRWALADPEVERRMSRPAPTEEERMRDWQGRAAIVETEVGESGLRVPRAVAEPAGGPAHLEIPFDIASVRQHEGSSSRRWRHALRDAFRLVFDLGYLVEDFSVLSVEHERRSFYLLSKGERAGPGAPGAGSRT